MTKDKEKRMTPEIRFKGFSGDWEQRKLGEVTDSYSGGTPSANNRAYYGGNIPFIRSAEINSSQTELFLTDVGLKESSAKMVEIGDILYALYGATSGEVGISQIKGAINQAILAIQPNENYDSQFIMHWLQLQKQSIIDKYLQGGQGNLSGSIVKNLEIYFPNYDEQVKIGTFFNKLDDAVTLHQQKYELLLKLKQAYLQLMFPQTRESTPQVRFADFHDNWEQRKLGEVSDVTKLAGFEFTKYVSYSDSGEIIALRGLNVKNGGLVLDEVKYIDGSDFSKLSRSKLFRKDILFTYVGTVGELAVIPEDDKFYLAPNVARIRMNKGANPFFVSQQMDDKSFYNRIILPLITTSSQPALSMENVRKIKLVLPIEKEQSMIAAFFTRLDQTITLHQQKIASLKSLKQAYLQKMFV